jgi:2,5-diamino-6-(ribosylamino)-4(3H)-pyrimidinone 5'-phosphate reductase
MLSTQRPETTLFLMSSVDGKISTGSTDDLDSDRDWKKIDGVREGVHQYYDIEKTTDLWSLNTGRVMAKIGINERISVPAKCPVSFVLVDRKPHLNENGIRYLCSWLKKVVIVTNNGRHPSLSLEKDLGNLHTVVYDGPVDLPDMLSRLKRDFSVNRLTIQSGGTINADFVRLGLVDHLRLVVAPMLVGGKDTPTICDGESITSVRDISKVKALRLVSCKVLENSFLDLSYDVVRS